jgi:hypothetical protein
MPELVQSYKLNLGGGNVMPTTPITVFHGKPRPWEVGL